MSVPTRGAAACIAAALLALLCGCAQMPWASSSAEPAAPPEPPASVPRLEVEAPDKLRKLLERYLDLSRSIAMPEAGDIADAEWSRLIAATPAETRALLQTEGFFEPQITLQRDRGPPFVVHLQVEPGPTVRVDRWVLDLEGDLERAAEAGDAAAQAIRAELRAAWTLTPGMPFNNHEWAKAKNAVIAHLRASGYAAATWSGSAAQVDAERKEVRIFAVADSGPLFHFGSLAIEGLAVHDADRVRALSGLKPGDALTERRLLDYQERLQKTGLYDQALVSYDPDPAHADGARVLVSLREAPLQQATVGVGISTDTGPRASLEYTHRRVFGAPLTARGKIEYGRDRQAFSGELSTHSGENYSRNLIGAEVESLLTSTDVVKTDRLRAGRARDNSRDETYAFVEAERGHECARGLGGDEVRCLDTEGASVNLHWVHRRLDSVVLPTDGYALSVQSGAGHAGAVDGKQGPYLRLYGRAIAYKPLGGDWYGQARAEWGQVFVSDDITVPDSQRFRAGGDESVRGYEWRTLSPVTFLGSNTGGKILVTGSVEVARPVSANLPSVWWAAFVDAGNAANGYPELEPAMGYGVGVRWRSPVGPLRLDVAWGQAVEQWRLHLSVGIAF